ncbi:MAG TPA: PEP-CTERM sorting domain-containing protein [Vicinamibacterales bacterium]
MKSLVVTVFAVGLSVTLARSAAASPITIDIGSFSGGTAVIHAPGTLANGLDVELGSVLITGDLGTFASYCVDLQHYDVQGANVTTVNTMDNWSNTAVPAHQDLGGGAASWLYNTYAAGAVGNQTDEAALSLAIWNSLYDNDFTVLSGSGFYVSSLSNASYGSLADSYLGSLQTYLNSGAPLPDDLWLQTADSSPHYAQDFIAPVPEPGTLVLLATGVAGAVTRRRTRRQSRLSTTAAH